MDLSRREFVKLGAAAAGVTASPLGRAGAQEIARVRWAARAAADMPEPDLPALLLSRAAFGARPGDVERARRIGAGAWIEEQLDHTAIDDSAVETALRQTLPSLSMPPGQLLTTYDKKQGELIAELRAATLYRMVYSPRLLYEVMVEFWSDHFNVYHLANLCRTFKTVDDRDVIRAHALGRFEDLLTASARSPAMLHFLDNDVNRRGRPNENYGREIMELHTLGVAADGVPYTEEDIKNVAFCFTGWGWDRRQASPTYGEFLYSDAEHDQGVKNVLGTRLAAALREQDGHEVIRLLCAHDATPVFLATKLVRRFVADDPSGQVPELVASVADTYARTDGDIKAMVATILGSREFAQGFARYGGRLSRPLDFVARLLRAAEVAPADFGLVAARGGGTLFARVNTALTAMGQLPYYWITPDGYPDVKDAWAGSSTTLMRWNLGLALAGVGSGRLGRSLVDGFSPVAQTPVGVTTAGAFVDFWTERILHRAILPEDRETVVAFLADAAGPEAPLAAISADRKAATVALVLDSPYFQWR